MNISYIKKAKDLITSYQETRAGFITIALEKSRRATPYIEEARVLQHRIKRVKTPEQLLDIPNIRSGLIASAGISDKAAAHLGEDGCTTAIKEFIDKFLIPAGSHFKEELVFRFLLSKGDSLGGRMRNIVGSLAQKKLCLSVISSLKLSNEVFYFLSEVSGQWISSTDINDDVEVENARGISWKTSSNECRTMYFNISVPFIGNNIDIILLKTPFSENVKIAINEYENYIALGELKGGIDPAGADEHWKTAKTALERIRKAFQNKGFTPYLFFIGAAIEKKMAIEIFDEIKTNNISNVANLTKPEHITSLSEWLIKL